jgi:hypothetical protein
MYFTISALVESLLSKKTFADAGEFIVDIKGVLA